MKAVLVEATSHNGTSAVDHFFSDVPYVPSDTNDEYDDVIQSTPIIEESLSRSISIGNVQILNDGSFDDLLDHAWEGWPIKIYLVDVDAPRSAAVLQASGIMGPIRAPSPSRIELSIRDANAGLDAPVQATLLPSGEPVPITLGKVFNVTPVLTDAATHEYQVHDGAITSVVTRAGGLAIAHTADYANGKFTLNAAPQGDVTCDVVQADLTPAEIITELAGRVGVTYDGATINDAEHGIYIDRQTSALDAIQRVARSIGGAARVDEAGEVGVYVLTAPAGTPVVEIEEDDVLRGTFTVRNFEMPSASVRLGYQRNWTPQRSLLGAVTEDDRKLYGDQYLIVDASNSVFDLLEMYTVTRADEKWYFNSAGLLVPAAANTNPDEYDPSTGERIGPSFWEALTNLVTQSEFANGVTDAPTRGGLLTAEAFSGLAGSTGLGFGYDGATSTFAYKNVNSADSTAHTLAVFVRMDDGAGPPAFGAASGLSSLNDFALVVDNNIPPPTGYAIKDCGDGLYRVSATVTTGVSAALNNGVVKYNTNSSRTFKVSGYQLEAAPTAGPYIPTEGSPVTRAADVGLDNPADYLAAAGALYAEVLQEQLVADARIVVLSDGTADNRIDLSVNAAGTGVRLQVVAGGVTQADISGGTISAGVPFKVAASYADDDFKLALNGASVGTDTSGTAPSVDRVHVGNDVAGANQTNGNHAALRYHARAFAQAELEALAS